MIFIVQSQNNLQKIASLNISFSYSISKGCAVKFRPFTSSALNRSIARWPEIFFFHQNLCHWGRGPGWPVVRYSFLPNPDGKNVILETSRQNLLKFCIRLPITILRTNPYWHFAQKTQKVGQNLSFLVKK